MTRSSYSGAQRAQAAADRRARSARADSTPSPGPGPPNRICKVQLMPPANRVGGEATVANVTSAVIFYCLCSGGMLIVNKLTMHHIPLPALATVCQFSTASVVVYGGRLLGQLEMDGFEWQKAKRRTWGVCRAFLLV